MSDLVRRELLVHVFDILDVWRAIAAKSRAGDQKQETDSITSGAQEADASADMHAVRSEHGASDGRDSGAASEKDLDEDELNCFLATAPSAFGEGENVGTTDGSGGTTEPLLEASDRQGCWSRVAIRLREGGVLQGPTTETHPIDLLSDDQVDQWLFDNNELDSLLRTDPTELALFEQAKVAAGDWPVKSADERNAEFTSLAWSVAQDLASNDQSASSWRRMDERDRHKRKERSSNTIEAETPDSFTLQQNKRAGPPSPVSLREQQEESDWSD
ncbi:hypothetical protein NDA16_002435 [Ustilago loliicola]|nr:hypothetical protein NDA16_002435 [Ustilago loliicola]